MPESGFTVAQKQLTIYEAGNSVPYTGKLELMAQHDLHGIIDRTLKDDARKYFDVEAFLQFKATPLRVVPTGGNSATAVTLTTNGAAAAANGIALRAAHTKAIVDIMKERNIPPYMDDDYICISHPTTFRTYKNDLEVVKQYTETGLTHIFAGEIGRYENTRHVEQTFIAKGGANNATTYDPWTQTAQAWSGGFSSWAFYMGGDTVTEAIAVPEEIRAKIPGDFGRSKAIAWYYLGGFGLVHDDATNARVLMWDSTT
jgi:hypothetical protein